MIRFRVEGGEALARTLRELPDRVSRKVLRDALTEAMGVPVQRRASSNAPRRAGQPDLAANIVISNARGQDGDVAIAVGPSKQPRGDQANRTFDLQAWFVEYGTVHRGATPFLRPAFSEAPGGLGRLGMHLWAALVARGFSTRSSGGGGGLT